jgi:uncharacterized protein YndB with AHSA1/START domain
MTDDRDLTLTRDIAATPEQLFRCWTQPALIRQWFTPPPWTVCHAEMEVRPGGASLIVMRGPDGQEMPCPGVYLEVVRHRRLVSTDAYTRAWEPAAKPFMTLVLTFDDLGKGRTRYTAVARHWTVADRDTHVQMGFHEGWGIATNQLAELAATL